MKIIGIGDIHGLSIWKDIINKEQNVDKFVFIGDYLDSFDISSANQIFNFKEILEFKKQNPTKVELLIGNHDFHYYIDSPTERYSGFKTVTLTNSKQLLRDEIIRGNIKVCFNYQNLLFSHAGITNTWIKNNILNIQPNENIFDYINDYLIYKPNVFLFNGLDSYGDDIIQSPMWVRPNSLNIDALENYIHIVGHTQQNSIKIGERSILIDTLPVGEYLIYEDDVFTTGKV